MKLIEGADYFIRVVPFPTYRTGGAVTPNDDGTFTIYINALLSLDRQRRAVKHEIKHIEDGDFYNDLPIFAIEDIT